MKIDHEYIKGLLEAFEAAPRPFTNIKELKSHGFNYETDDFMFHMDILLDLGLIESDHHNLGIGYSKHGRDEVGWAVIDLRLTAYGHDFLASLNQPDVWDNIKTNFKEAGMDTVMTVAKDLAVGYAKNKVKQLLE